MKMHWEFALCCLLGAAGAAGSELPLLVFAPAQPTDSDRVLVTVSGSNSIACGAYFSASYDLDARRILLRGYRIDPPQPCGEGTWTSQLPLQRLAPDSYTVEATLDDDALISAPLAVQPTPTTARLGDAGRSSSGGSFDVSLSWRDPATGQLRQAPVVQHSTLAAQFWFFDAGNPEVTIKILDGLAINAHFWLFLSSMTTVEFTLEVRHCISLDDPPFCAPIKRFASAAGENLDLVDVEAFSNDDAFFAPARGDR